MAKCYLKKVYFQVPQLSSRFKIDDFLKLWLSAAVLLPVLDLQQPLGLLEVILPSPVYVVVLVLVHEVEVCDAPRLGDDKVCVVDVELDLLAGVFVVSVEDADDGVVGELLVLALVLQPNLRRRKS